MCVSLSRPANSALDAMASSIQLAGCDPSLLKDDGTEYMMGIDEAGRGPTLGPMVYGSAFCAVDDEQKLRKMGFMDSKQLTEAELYSIEDINTFLHGVCLLNFAGRQNKHHKIEWISRNETAICEAFLHVR